MPVFGTKWGGAGRGDKSKRPGGHKSEVLGVGQDGLQLTHEENGS